MLSGTLGNNLLNLQFPLEEEEVGGRQQILMALRDSELNDETLLDTYYDLVIDTYDEAGNYLILLYLDSYDVMTRTKDNINVDESEEVYKYMLCAICPVTLSKPGLGYLEKEQRIGARIRDWVVGAPVLHAGKAAQHIGREPADFVLIVVDCFVVFQCADDGACAGIGYLIFGICRRTYRRTSPFPYGFLFRCCLPVWSANPNMQPTVPRISVGLWAIAVAVKKIILFGLVRKTWRKYTSLSVPLTCYPMPRLRS